MLQAKNGPMAYLHHIHLVNLCIEEQVRSANKVGSETHTRQENLHKDLDDHP